MKINGQELLKLLSMYMWYFLHFHILILWFSVFDTLSISLPSSKLTNSLISIYRHYTIDIADPNSMLDACHMNFVIDLAHQEVSVVRGLRIFSLAHARDKMKNIFLYMLILFFKIRNFLSVQVFSIRGATPRQLSEILSFSSGILMQFSYYRYSRK